MLFHHSVIASALKIAAMLDLIVFCACDLVISAESLMSLRCQGHEPRDVTSVIPHAIDQMAWHSSVNSHMANKKVSVSSTSLSMTLPISCQICLGKVSVALREAFAYFRVYWNRMWRADMDLELKLLCGIHRLGNPLFAPINMSSVQIAWICGCGLTRSVQHAERR